MIMARFIRAVQRTLRLPPLQHSTKTLIHGLQLPSLQSHNTTSKFRFQTRSYQNSFEILKSPFESNVLRILRNEIEYLTEDGPPNQPPRIFNSFTVEDHPGQQWVTLRSKFREKEDIKIDVTMFDGCIFIPKLDDDFNENDITGQELRPHISLLVDISKGEDCDMLEFVCSAWPDCLEIQKVFIYRHGRLLPRPWLGPGFKSLDDKLRNALREFLEERGVNDELSVFLHEYMMNKDRTELIQWLRNVKSFVEK
ncbi:hypothetical protein PVL29_004401 [Vitis rotundifolia]|uniref:Mitochondrial glycoprotein n=1 Tax=Vitis rotundifolia TaxID=103349 RepID=A0AA39A833_VITRO|nr:hypothetical protein PVL29_004401 [Vitis rotundifolia]